MSLSSESRGFFARLAEAAFANPFGEERWRLDAELTELPADSPRVITHLLKKVSEELDASSGEPDALNAQDAQLVYHAALFETFHRFTDDFDDLIRQQSRSSAPVPFPAHAEVAKHLHRRNVPADQLQRALELFYQLRRAFFFLNESLVGKSTTMRALKASLWNQVFGRDILRFHRHLEGRMQDFSVLLVGATGTGKSAAAAALGRSGFIPWRGKAFAESFEELFLPLNLSELPGPLLESALFGHIKGAFTGAIASREGVFARSSPHGVIFLDEIGEVGTPEQIKLLRVLQERVFSPIGSAETQRFEGRVIGATHQSIQRLREEGRMREDFYYRLCSDEVRLPGLAERIADDPAELDLLTLAIVRRTIGHSATDVEQEVLSIIHRDVPAEYDWPGNVRELEQCVRRVLITGACAPRNAAGDTDLWTRARKLDMTLEQLNAAYCAAVYQSHGSYESAARVLEIDRRTVKKFVDRGS